MLLAFQQIQLLENKLDEQVKNSIIQDYRISLKADMRVEVFILVANSAIFNSEVFNTEILKELRFNKNAIEIIPITEREKNHDSLYNHIFSDKYPNPNSNSKVDVGLVWRFDTLLANDCQVEKSENPCNVVTFYSYKGGMGRTTTLCSYAIHLAQNGKRVVVIDCDFEAPGFLNFFNTKREQGQKSGLIEYLLDKEFSGKENLNLKDDYLIPVSSDYSGGGDNKIFVLPAGNLSYADSMLDDRTTTNKSETLRLNLYHYIHGLARLNIANTDNMLFQFRELFKDLAQSLELSKDDYILIDSRTGFNEIFGITALNLSDIIVSFFGSSEQTRAGLYFLLDKYRDLLHQPKLILVNSIIPNDEIFAKRFNDSFKRLLNDYEAIKDSDWAILGSVPDFQLHENKVLKEIGVQFYDEDELNEKKEKELFELIKTHKFIDNDGLEKSFDDLNKIFKKLDEFTIKNLLPIFQVDNLSIIQLRQVVLEHLAKILKQDASGSVAIFAEDKTTIEVSTFFYRDCMEELFKKDKFIIQGFKGSGKTYLYKALKDNEITKIILKKAKVGNSETYQFIDIIEVKNADNNYKQLPFSKIEIRSIHNFQSFWKIYLWTSTMLDISLKPEFQNFRILNSNTQLEKDLEFLKNATETERKSIFKKYIENDENLILIERDLKNLNDFLVSQNIKLFVLFDQLDRVANLEDWSIFITPLVEFWRDNYNKPTYTNIFPKIFIRTDIINRINTNNSLSLIKSNFIPIEWGREEIYAYFFKLVFSKEEPKQAFFKLMKEYKQYSNEVISNIEGFLNINNQPPLDVDLIKPLLNTFFGSEIKSPKGGNLGDPFEFFYLNFSNADDNKTFNLRPFINLIIGSVINGLSNKLPKYQSRYSEKLVPVFPDLEQNPPVVPILHYAYTTDSDVRDKATKEHFDDLTQEAGNEDLRKTIDYIKSSKIDDKYKKVVLTNIQLENLLEEIFNFYEISNKKVSEWIDELKFLLSINGIVVNDEKHKVYRFAQMYKYWLGLKKLEVNTHKKETPLKIGQKLSNKITNLKKGFGFIATGYEGSELYFHATNLTGVVFNELKIGDWVEFTISKNDRSLAAINVRKISK